MMEDTEAADPAAPTPGARLVPLVSSVPTLSVPVAPPVRGPISVMSVNGRLPDRTGNVFVPGISPETIDGKADKSTTYTKTETDSAISAAIATVTDSAPEAFDTLKEIADWIQSDTTGAAKMQSDIADLKDRNEFTNAEKAKLAGVEAGANKTVVDSSLSPNSENPVQNKVVTSALNGKATTAQGAKADAALSRAEAEAGFTEWVWGDGVNRGQPEWDAESNRWSFEGGSYVSHSAVSSEDDVVLPTLYTIEEDEPMPWTATRTRLPTTADIPTDNAQLTNGAGYATTTAMTAALALKADAASLPYALVDVTMQTWAFSGTAAGAGHHWECVYDNGVWALYNVPDGSTWEDVPNPTDFIGGGSETEIEFNSAGVTATKTTPTAHLTDRAVNRVTLGSGVESAVFKFPAKTQGKARDFMLRLVVTGSTVPEIGFVENDGTTEVAFDADDDSWADIEQGVNILMFTDTQEASA